jgi:hypothetical protein
VPTPFSKRKEKKSRLKNKHSFTILRSTPVRSELLDKVDVELLKKKLLKSVNAFSQINNCKQYGWHHKSKSVKLSIPLF